MNKIPHPANNIKITRKFGNATVTLFVPAAIMNEIDVPVDSGLEIRNWKTPVGGFLAFYAPCPMCGKMHSTWDHDLNWYFVCCCGPRLVWRVSGYLPDLELVEEDCDEG